MHLSFLINFTQLTRVARCPAVIITATSLFLKSRPTWGYIVFLNIFNYCNLQKSLFLLWTRPYRPNRLASWCFFMIQRFMITYSCHSPKSLRSKEFKYLNSFVSRLDEERRRKFAYFWRNYMARGGEWRRRRRKISRRRIKWRRRVEGNELKARQKADLKSGKYSLYLAKDRGRRWLLEPISSLRIRNSRTRFVFSLTHKRLVGQWLMRLRCRFNRDIGPWRNMNTWQTSSCTTPKGPGYNNKYVTSRDQNKISLFFSRPYFVSDNFCLIVSFNKTYIGS